MINENSLKCKNRNCNNPVVNGKYCEYCRQIRREKRNKFLKISVGTVTGIGSIVLAAVFKKPVDIFKKRF